MFAVAGNRDTPRSTGTPSTTGRKPPHDRPAHTTTGTDAARRRRRPAARRRDLRPRPDPHPDRLRRPPPDGHQGPRPVRRVHRHRSRSATDLASSTAEATMQTASIETGTADRDTHLRSGDFLEVEKYPTITFAQRPGRLRQGHRLHRHRRPHHQGRHPRVTLDVELDGVAKDPWGNEKLAVTARTEIDREDFGHDVERRARDRRRRSSPRRSSSRSRPRPRARPDPPDRAHRTAARRRRPGPPPLAVGASAYRDRTGVSPG